MPRYRVENKVTGDVYEVEAPYAQDACERLGWHIGFCHVKCIRDGPHTHLSQEPVKVSPGDSDKGR
ncbi:MAG: hypothetical protein HWN68_14530 [Desulfobacterales bacterium]|nr:hypothetical protein [Desulfobacterales bacterium]